MGVVNGGPGWEGVAYIFLMGARNYFFLKDIGTRP